MSDDYVQEQIARDQYAMTDDWMQKSLDAIHDDLALFALADMLAREWCAEFGGATATEMIAQRAAVEPQARVLLEQLLRMPPDHRRTLAHRLKP